MTDLLPCPFCGGEAVTRLADNVPFRGMLHSWYVTCMNDRCGCELGFYGMDENGTCGTYETEEEAIAAWNTRAERTCTFSEGHNGNETEKMVLPKCSVCGVTVDGTWCDDYHTLNGVELEYAYNYCPNCGAKVME